LPPQQREQQAHDDGVPGERRQPQEQGDVRRPGHCRTHTPRDRPARFGRVQDEPADQERQGAEADRRRPRDDVLAPGDDMTAHWLGEQVDDRPVVDLGTEDRGRGEERDERQDQREAQVEDGLVAGALAGQDADHQGEDDQQRRDQEQDEAATAAQQCLGGETQDRRVHRHPPTR
jgi:hypothetical protein